MKIEDIKVNKILDSRGEWTIEVEIISDGIKEKASVPSGKSKGSYEAISLSYEEIQNNLKQILNEVKNIDFRTSKEFDQFLIERAGKNKEKLGANFTLGASIAFARVLAKKEGLELWEYLTEEYTKQHENETKQHEIFYVPGLVLNIIGGGVHSKNNLDFQEYWLVGRRLTQTERRLTQTREDFNTLLAKILNIVNKLEEKLPKPLGRNDEGAFCTNFSDNYEPFLFLKELKDDFGLGADIAANQINKNLNWNEVYAKLKDLEVIYLEDPFKEDEFENFANLRKQGFKVIGDDLTVTNVERLKIALDKNSVDGVIVKPNQVGTILETFEFVKLAKENNLFTIFSHRSGETNDHWLIDLGIAFKADFFKIGPPLQGERVTKYNRLREILEKF
ncbi:MAG: enolase C-terminal domain-like protein [Minisyncoccia bacterium]|jgi:enolase